MNNQTNLNCIYNQRKRILDLAVADCDFKGDCNKKIPFAERRYCGILLFGKDAYEFQEFKNRIFSK